MRKFVLVFLIFSLVFLLFGCLDMETIWTLKEDNSIIMSTTLVPESGYTDDMTTYFEAFKIAFAPLFKKMTYYKSTVSSGYSYNDAYVFDMSESITIEELKNLGFNISFNGTKFEFEIPKILDSEPYSPDDVIITLIIKFPKEVDIATSPYIEKDTVIWKITKKMLYTGSVIKAYLK